MVSADITHIHDTMQPRCENLIRQPEICSYGTLDFSRQQIFVQYGKCSEWGYFHCYPAWREMVGIFRLERFDELFIAAAVFFVNLWQQLCMADRVWEKRGIFKPIRIMLWRQDICCLCTDCNLYLFNLCDNQFAELTVKLIDVIGRFKCTARFENMLSFVRQ